jgi:predicted amidohydrolase
MKSELNVTLVQTELTWHDPAANRGRFDRLTSALAGQTDVVVLPEMFTTGFTMASQEVAEPVDGPSTQWMRETARRLGAVVTGSIVTRDGDACFNRLIWMRPDGSHAIYDKRHLFRMASEHEHYDAGIRRTIVEVHGWRVCPLVCYDLRFPVWSRNRFGTREAYDVLIYTANWPAPRGQAWRTLLRARAIENLSYCCGVNRIGTDGVGAVYAGDSVALDFIGQPLCEDLAGEQVRTVTLRAESLTAFRRKFPAYLDADAFEISIDPAR